MNTSPTPESAIADMISALVPLLDVVLIVPAVVLLGILAVRTSSWH